MISRVIFPSIVETPFFIYPSAYMVRKFAEFFDFRGDVYLVRLGSRP